MQQVSYSEEKVKKSCFLEIVFLGGSYFQIVPVPRLTCFTTNDQHHCIQHKKLFKSVLGFVFLALLNEIIPPESEKSGFSMVIMRKTFIKRQRKL